MINSSQPLTCSTTLDNSSDTVTITSSASYGSGNGTVVLNGLTDAGTFFNSGSISSIGISGGGTTTISIDTLSDYSTQWAVSEEWIDSFPDWSKVQNMIKQYPALKIALRNFETIYKLVKDDYDSANS